MSVQFFIAPPASGKTHRCIDRVRQVLKECPLSQVRVVLPDHLQCVAFRRRLASGGGAMGAHIGTFGDLYRALLIRAGRAYPLASEPVVYRLIKAAIEEVSAGGGLAHYAPVTDTPGFLRTLRERFAELKRARVFPESLLARDGWLEPPLTELARIYTAYQAALQAVGWADPEGLNWLAVEALEREPALAQYIHLLVIDGFDSFNGAQLAALRLLGKIVPEVIVTLPGTPDMERAAHRRFARSLAALQTEIPGTVLDELPHASHLLPPLQHLEQGLFESGPEAMAGTGRITFIETRTPVDEAREALRWVKARIVRHGLRPDECALITPAPERYRPYLREAAAEFGLPLRFTQGEMLTSAPGIAALLDLLELPLQGWPRRLALEALRAPYFDLAPFGLTPREADSLEIVSRFGPVISGLDQWQEALERLARLEEQPPAEEGEDLTAPALPVGAQAEFLWRSLSAFAACLSPPGPQPTRAWVRWLENLLEELRFFERQETLRDRASALGLRETLRALVLGEGVTGAAPVAFEGFLAGLRSSLEGTFFQERLGWNRSTIQVLRVLEARGLRFRAVAVLGLSEGLFPEVEREDPFLSEAVRAELGLEPRLEREQAGLFYQAVTRADRFLLLTRPTLADDGERWEPSPYWTASTSLFTDRPALIRPDDPRPLADAASPEEVLSLAVRRGSLPKSFRDLVPHFERLRHGRDVLHARLARGAANSFEGDLSALAWLLGEAYGPGHLWSPSRLEAYGLCPHLFYVGHALELEAHEPPEPGLDPRQLGSLLHAILEKAYRQAEEPVDPETVLVALEEVARAEFAAAPERYGFRPSPLWHVEQEHLLDRLAETVRGLAGFEEGWRPVAFEQPFGRNGAPPLELVVGGEIVRLGGVIDRLDVNDRGELRVVDYKTGSSNLGPRALADGRRLQLPLYARAARDALGMGEPVEGLYWAILAGDAGALKLGRFRYEDESGVHRGPEGAFEVARRHVGRILQGVRAGRFPPVPPRGGCPRYCPAAAWCWRYVPAAW